MLVLAVASSLSASAQTLYNYSFAFTNDPAYFEDRVFLRAQMEFGHKEAGEAWELPGPRSFTAPFNP